MPLPYTFGVGVGLVDKAQVDANFASIVSGTSSTPQNNLTAHAGGTQAAALVLPTGTTRYRFTTVATAGDSAALPLAAGQSLTIINAGANSMNVFALNGSADTINGTAGSTAYALAAGKVAEFLSAGAGAWNVLLSA